MKPAHPPTGRKIILELVKEMEERLYPLLYRTLPPSVYHVYLHPDDYREVEAVTSLIIADAERGLNARVDELNRRSRLLTLVAGGNPPIEVPPGGWQIHVQPEANGDIAKGSLGIVSRLSVPAAPDYRAGVPTARIVRTVITGAHRRSVTTEEPVAPLRDEPATVPDGQETITAEPRAGVVRSDEGVGGFARLTYVDEQGPHLFVVRKDVISIGRGGSAHWVDVQVVATPRVSRVHCRIRRDEQGRFFLQDVSTWGTSVDGQPVAPFVQRNDGRIEETGHERELQSGARIALADVITVDFQAQPFR